MDAFTPSISAPEGDDVVEGYSAGRFVRLCGALCFLVINPLFVYVWLDDPKFVQGPIDFPEVFMAIVTAGMLFLGVCGLAINFARTRVSADAIEWRVFRRHRLELDQVQYVQHIVRLGVCFIPVVSIMRVVSDGSKTVEIAGGTAELHQCFLRIQTQYPK